MSNQRKNPRLNCLVPVDGKEGGLYGGSQTIDFSKGGMGIISQKKIPINDEIAIEIDLEADGSPVFVIGKVVWNKKIAGTDHYRVGLTFEDVLRGSKSRLNDYFKK